MITPSSRAHYYSYYATPSLLRYYYIALYIDYAIVFVRHWKSAIALLHIYAAIINIALIHYLWYATHTPLLYTPRHTPLILLRIIRHGDSDSFSSLLHMPFFIYQYTYHVDVTPDQSPHHFLSDITPLSLITTLRHYRPSHPTYTPHYAFIAAAIITLLPIGVRYRQLHGIRQPPYVILRTITLSPLRALIISLRHYAITPLRHWYATEDIDWLRH